MLGLLAAVLCAPGKSQPKKAALTVAEDLKPKDSGVSSQLDLSLSHLVSEQSVSSSPALPKLALFEFLPFATKTPSVSNTGFSKNLFPHL